MKRVIKFKGNRVEDGELVHGTLSLCDDSTKAFINNTKPTVEDQYAFTYEVDPDSVGEFIGIHDSNKKEIYEGQKVLHNAKEYVVEYMNSRCMFIARNIKTGNFLNFCVTYPDNELNIDNRFQIID